MEKQPTSRDHGAFAANARVGGMLGAGSFQGNSDNHALASEAVVDLLLQAQRDRGCITDKDVQRIASQTRTSPANVFGVASFYSLFDPSRTDAAEPPAIRVCDGPACRLHGSESVTRRCRMLSEDSYRLLHTSCLGYCEHAPAVMVDTPDGDRRVVHVLSDDDVPGQMLSWVEPPHAARLLMGGSVASSRRPLTARFGVDPWSLDAARAAGAYDSVRQALQMDPAEIIDVVASSGLRGRGGAGFNTARKWSIAAETGADERFVVCNADESEPGTFKDRALMENDPHLLLEAMTICGRAINASVGIIYVRGEYGVAIKLLQHSIEEARRHGLLGQNILGSGFDFDIHVHSGAGAYICGEESALLESLEGKRGEPRERPPFPASVGFRGKPTVVNNVETFCYVPSILSADAAANEPEPKQPTQGRQAARTPISTRLFCLSGHVAQSGLCEMPLGVTLRQLVWDTGGGMRDGSEFKFALTGGAAGTFVPETLLDVPLLLESLDAGVAVGSGAVVVADQSVNVARMLLWLLEFFARESCGKCTPCRIGTVEARDIVQRVVSGRSEPGDLDRLQQLADLLQMTSLCGLGQSLAWPIRSALKHFPEDFERPR